MSFSPSFWLFLWILLLLLKLSWIKYTVSLTISYSESSYEVFNYYLYFQGIKMLFHLLFLHYSESTYEVINYYYLYFHGINLLFRLLFLRFFWIFLRSCDLYLLFLLIRWLLIKLFKATYDLLPAAVLLIISSVSSAVLFNIEPKLFKVLSLKLRRLSQL